MFTLAKEDEAGHVQAVVHQENAARGAMEQSAAEYDPSMDRREDEEKRVRGEEKKDVEIVGDNEEEVEDDDDVDDMFALETDEPKKQRKVKRKVAVSTNEPPFLLAVNHVRVETRRVSACYYHTRHRCRLRRLLPDYPWRTT